MEIKNLLNIGPAILAQRTSSLSSPALKPTPYDSVSFSGRQDSLEERFLAIADDVERHVMDENKKFNFETVRSAIEKHCGERAIMRLKNNPNNAPEINVPLSYYYSRIDIYSSGNAILNSKQLHIGQPKSNSRKHRVEFINDLNLEIMRMLYTEDKETSCVPLINEYIESKKSDKKEIAETKALVPVIIFFKIKKEIEKQSGIDAETLLPVAMSQADEEYLEKIIKDRTGKDLETFLRSVINNVIIAANKDMTPLLDDDKEEEGDLHNIPPPSDNIGVSHSNYPVSHHLPIEKNTSYVDVDSKHTLGVIELLAKNEAKAHNLALERTKRLLDTKGPTDKDLVVLLYDKLGKVAGEMKQAYEHVISGKMMAVTNIHSIDVIQ